MTIATTTTGGTLTLGDQTLHVEDLEMVGPEFERFDCQEPDPAWVHNDSEGHVHRWMVPLSEPTAEGVLPTAERTLRHIDCDGSCPNWDCDGYDVPVWHCVQCGDEIQPGFRRGSRSHKVFEGYVVVHTTSPPRLTIPSTGVQGEEATVVWPSGAGQMTTMIGKVWEGPGEVTFSSRQSVERRQFQLVPDQTGATAP